MIEELTTTQIALRCGVSERTVQRWIKEHRIAATRLAYNRYAVEDTELKRLRLAEHINEETRIQALERQVRELAEQVVYLDATLRIVTEQLRQLTTLTPKPAPRPYMRLAERPSVAPTVPTAAGLVPAVQFAEAHGVGRGAAKSAFKRQYIHTTKVQGDQAHYLDEQQRRAAITYWRSHHTPGFATCTDPACPCHTG